MTEQEMEKLADIIVGKLITAQKELDKEFIRDLEVSNVPIEIHERISNKDKMIMEITRLTILLDNLESNEKFEEAVVCRDRLSYLRNEISKL